MNARESVRYLDIGTFAHGIFLPLARIFRHITEGEESALFGDGELVLCMPATRCFPFLTIFSRHRQPSTSRNVATSSSTCNPPLSSHMHSPDIHISRLGCIRNRPLLLSSFSSHDFTFLSSVYDYYLISNFNNI